MPESDLELLLTAAEEAGDIACRYFKSDPQVWDKDGDAGPVTEADLAVDDMLRGRLLSQRPDYGWLSEETEDNDARQSKDTVFIIDPIDGTRSFIAGSKHWSHSLAIAHEGKITAAVVFLPVAERCYAAALGCGSTVNGQPISVSDKDDLRDARVLANKANFADRFWANGTPPFAQHFRSSLAYRLSLVAEGAFDAMLTLRPTWEWDIAAGALLVTEAGGQVTDLQGRDLLFNAPHPQATGVLAGPTTLRSHLHRALA